MNESTVQVICGPAKGKTTAALGRGISALIRGKTVFMVQFMKGSFDSWNMEVIKRLEPEFKMFRFERSTVFFNDLEEKDKEEVRVSIRNGLNFARKVLVTGECDILILDEILGVLDEQIITLEELINLIGQARQAQIQLIFTGNIYPSVLDQYVDEVTELHLRK